MSQLHFNVCSSKVLASLQVIHYGSENFDLKKFKEVSNPPEDEDIGKPFGGLWTCPIGASRSWKDECTFTGTFLESLEKSFELRFFESSKILLINTYEDLARLPMVREPKRAWDTFIDWELIGSYADAVWLTENGAFDTRLTAPYHLTTWVIESILILNPLCCYQV